MTFAEALEVLRREGKVKREGWDLCLTACGDDVIWNNGDEYQLFIDDAFATDWEEVTA